MIHLVVTFGMPMPTQNGLVDFTAQYEKVVAHCVKDGMLDIHLEDGRVIVWNWSVVRNVMVDPHGSILKPQGPKIVPAGA